MDRMNDEQTDESACEPGTANEVDAVVLAKQARKIDELLAFVESLPTRSAGDWRREDLYD